MARKRPNAVLGFLAGALGGAVGTLVLNVFQGASLKGTEALEQHTPLGYRYSREQRGLQRTFEQAHMHTAEVVANAVGVELSYAQKQASAPLAEYAFGILCGGVYGALAEYVPQVKLGFGTVYGGVLFTGASEVVLPAIGFVPPPQDRTATQHVGGLAGNVVYGAVTEGIRTLLR